MPSQKVSAQARRLSSGTRSGSSLSVSAEKKQNGRPAALSSSNQAGLQPPDNSPVQRSHSRTHIVGQNRAPHVRTSSYGKNLGRASRAHHGPGEGTNTARHHHHRSLSHTPPTSPRLKASTKRTGSALSLAHDVSNVSLKKNASTVSLRKDSSRLSFKAGEPKAAAKKALKSDSPAQASSINGGTSTKRGRKHPAVHFDLDPDSPDADWTEVSNSESPSKTRSGGGSRASPEPDDAEEQSTAAVTSPGPPADELRAQLARSPSSPETRALHTKENNSPSRPRTVSAPMHHQPHQRQDGRAINDPQAMLTSRLLGRHPPHNAPPQMTAVSATFIPGHNSPRGSARSPASTAPGTPGGRDKIVSRFIVGSQDGTPGTAEDGAGSVSPLRRPYSGGHSSNMETAAGPGADRDDDDSRDLRRRKSTGNILLPSRGSPDSDGSASSLRHHAPQPSRIQQKLWLQRASSNIEPHQLMPGDTGIGIGSGAGGGGGHLVGAGFGGDARDPRLQKQFDRAEVEYNVLRRFQNPVLDSIRRLNKIRGIDIGGHGRSASISAGSASISTKTGTPKTSSFSIDRRSVVHHAAAGNDSGNAVDGRSSRGGMVNGVRSGSGGSIRSTRSSGRVDGHGYASTDYARGTQGPAMSEHRGSFGPGSVQGQFRGDTAHAEEEDISEKERLLGDGHDRFGPRTDREDDAEKEDDAGVDEEEEQDDAEADLVEQIKRRMWERMDGAGSGD